MSLKVQKIASILSKDQNSDYKITSIKQILGVKIT